MRTPRTLLLLGLAALSLGALAQAPPRPPIGGPKPGVGPGPGSPAAVGGPDLLIDPQVQRQLGLTKAQIAKIRALRPAPPRAGAKPPLPPKPGASPPLPPKLPLPPKPGAEDARIDAILTKTQRVQLRAIRAKRDRAAPGGPLGAPRPPRP